LQDADPNGLWNVKNCVKIQKQVQSLNLNKMNTKRNLSRMKKVLLNLIYALIFILCLWPSVGVIIQRIKCTKMTETELFLIYALIFIFNFKNCN